MNAAEIMAALEFGKLYDKLVAPPKDRDDKFIYSEEDVDSLIIEEDDGEGSFLDDEVDTGEEEDEEESDDDDAEDE